MERLFYIVCFALLVVGCQGEASVNSDDEDSPKKPKPTLDAPPPPPPGVVDINNNDEPSYAYDDVEALNKLLVESAERTYSTSEEISKYDDAEWHYDGDFPGGTPIRNGFAHIGFFLSWAVEEGLVNEFIQVETPEGVEATLNRSVSPIALLEFWDGKLVSDMLSEEGNAFAMSYYPDEENGYLPDYMAEFSDHKLYKVKPTWENYDRIKPVISKRYEEWRAGQE